MPWCMRAHTPHVSVWLSQHTIHYGMHTNELSSCAYTARGAFDFEGFCGTSTATVPLPNPYNIPGKHRDPKNVVFVVVM